MLTEDRFCRDCGKPYEAMMYRGAWTTRCPTCADIAQRRPSVVIERNLLAGPIICRIESLPGQWEKFQSGQHDDNYVYRMIVKGSEFGAAWSGRIDLYSPVAWRPGEVVALSEIEAVHKVWVRYENRSTSPFTQLKNGPAMVSRRIKLLPSQIGEDAQDAIEEIERHVYVRLDRPEAVPEPPDDLPRLVWITARTKTTLFTKGFGRQYAHALRGAPLWEKRIRGGYRSGRAYTEGALAIVSVEHPLECYELYDHAGRDPRAEALSGLSAAYD